MRYLILFIPILLFFSCNKERIKISDHKDLVGTFEWYHSVNFYNESESIETIPDRYAIKFNKNGKIKVFENGELISEGYVRAVGEFNSYYGQRVDCYLFSANFNFNLIEGNLENDTYPIDQYTNRFRKL